MLRFVVFSMKLDLPMLCKVMVTTRLSTPYLRELKTPSLRVPSTLIFDAHISVNWHLIYCCTVGNWIADGVTSSRADRSAELEEP